MILDRGYIIVEPKQQFIDWLMKHQDTEPVKLEEVEPTVYLIDDDFMDDEIVLNKSYEEIFMYELESTAVHESFWPLITIEQFKEFFNVKIGVSVYDIKSK
jgi:hypothetical protein